MDPSEVVPELEPVGGDGEGVESDETGVSAAGDSA